LFIDELFSSFLHDIDDVEDRLIMATLPERPEIVFIAIIA